MNTKKQKRKIASHIMDIVGGNPEFKRYNDNNECSSVHIMMIKDIPENGVNFYSTIGTSEHSVGLKIDAKPLRLELIFVADEKYSKIENILATCAFCIINSKYKCFPGAVFNDVINQYIIDTDMKHIIFVQPFLWENDFPELELDDKIIEWLLAVPISENELTYSEKNGFEALEDLFEKRQIDIFNIYRESVV